MAFITLHLGKINFEFRLLKYAFDPKTQCYQPIEFETDGKIIKDIIGNRNVLTQNLKI